ncbi:glucose-6-phosphate dehydrogenase [Facklamia miroungae]|uniref:Glucose-6-phosphate 1-dehydrogenase n=1 Tax=Facklamia miroungae TaxID=120956 RepID=A0A1G7R4Z2_9LACT|nr:glucose-6-phosphate dehydrogenase [Facklamia miroungae]NKZ29168.1 glucose-6-phosphate dehydrogenase [Facklamia miroungae]SDG05229.1 glucose-6-phosphate 1-dehydrogenase [Facklamia miroungae]
MKDYRLIMTIFGASGDLARRKLYPALYQLYNKGFLAEHFAIIGTARREWDHDFFRQIIRESLNEGIQVNDNIEAFLSHFYYQSNDVKQVEQYFDLKKLSHLLAKKYQTNGNQIFYISLSPNLFPIITSQLKEQGLLTKKGYNRLIIEKPFGYNENSAEELQAQLTQSFSEEQIYRIDHYLGKSIVNQILPIRMNNFLSRFLWDPTHIDHIQITLDEELGVGERGTYYETSGVSRDMIQNHALQLLTLVTMDLPENTSNESLRQKKIARLKQLKHYANLKDLKEHVVRGQYIMSKDQKEIAYRQEKNVAPDSKTETYMALKIGIDQENWLHTPIYLRSGKQLNNKQTDIKIIYKKEAENIPANYLQIELAPKPGIRLALSQSDSTHCKEIKELHLSYQLPHELAKIIPGDYEKLLFDCMNGDLSNFAHFLEVKYAWQFIDSIHSLWQEEDIPDLAFYPAQSNGPEAGDWLIEKDHRFWFNE